MDAVKCVSGMAEKFGHILIGRVPVFFLFLQFIVLDFALAHSGYKPFMHAAVIMLHYRAITYTLFNK